MKGKIKIALLFVFITQFGYCQTDTLPYTSYRFHPIFFIDLGFSAAPASLKYPYSSDIKQLQFRHNNKIMFGIGASYRWFAFRIGAALVGNFKPVSKYGKSNYYDLGLQFSIRKYYSEIDLRYYTNYVVENAYKWDSTYTKDLPNDRNQNIDVYNIAMKMWYLNNKNFRMDPFTGNRGSYNKQVFTWYLGGRLDIYGITNKNGPLIPTLLQDSTNTKTSASAIGAIELGIIPGVGYVNKYKKFQYGVMAAVGPMLQFKSYTVNDSPTGLAGIVLRYDFKMIFGYNVPRCFVMAHIEVDTKSIGFDKLKYMQTFYSFKVQAGYRFKEKLPKKGKKGKKI